MTSAITISTTEWWATRRWRYNLGLVISGLVAFIAYAIIFWTFEERFGPDTEITVFTIIFQGIGYMLMIGLANLFYFLGPFCEQMVAPNDLDRFRRRLFALGFWFSCALPFSVPVLVLAQALFSPVP